MNKEAHEKIIEQYMDDNFVGYIFVSEHGHGMSMYHLNKMMKNLTVR